MWPAGRGGACVLQLHSSCKLVCSFHSPTFLHGCGWEAACPPAGRLHGGVARAHGVYHALVDGPDLVPLLVRHVLGGALAARGGRGHAGGRWGGETGARVGRDGQWGRGGGTDSWTSHAHIRRQGPAGQAASSAWRCVLPPPPPPPVRWRRPPEDELAQRLQLQPAPQHALHRGHARVGPPLHQPRLHKPGQLALGEHGVDEGQAVGGEKGEGGVTRLDSLAWWRQGRAGRGEKLCGRVLRRGCSGGAEGLAGWLGPAAAASHGRPTWQRLHSPPAQACPAAHRA
jgi:hypothetical protein